MKAAAASIGALVLASGDARLGAGRGQRLLLGAGRMVHARRQRVPEGDRHQSLDDARRARARPSPSSRPRRRTPRATCGSAAPAIRTCRRPRKNLTEAYKSPKLAELHPWAVKQNTDSGGKTVGIYAGALGFGFNTELLAKKNVKAPACWADLLKPEFKGEIQMANPNSSGTAYVAIATLVQLMGEEKAFDYLKKMHANINAYTRSGTAPMKAVARGETMVVDQLRA